MAEKILYILGAGASATILPLARNIYDNNGNISKPGLVEEIRTFDIKSSFIEYNLKPEILQMVQIIKTRLERLAENAGRFQDMDTYAKYLYLINSGGDEFQNIKQGLSEFFSLKQLLLRVRDSRYLPWLVSIMKTKRFPENIKILNWNYDFQVQLGFSEFGFVEDVRHHVGGFSHSGLAMNYYPNLDPTFKDHSDLSLIHLNGIAGFVKQQDLYTASVFQPEHAAAKEATIRFFEKHNTNPQINFAWENNQYHKPLMKHINKMIEGTTILVVIGYSFPFFNREIDKKIFERLKLNQSLRKIYYQDPLLTGKQLVSQFNLDKDTIDIVHISQTNNFHIPFEY